MLLRIMGIPELVYYRGRFRASMVWPGPGREESTDVQAPGEPALKSVKGADKLGRENPLPPAVLDTRGLQARAARSH